MPPIALDHAIGGPRRRAIDGVGAAGTPDIAGDLVLPGERGPNSPREPTSDRKDCHRYEAEISHIH